jgi:hypothetical protein
MNKANKGEIIIYTLPDGTSSLDVKLDGDTVWLSQAQMVSLFQRDRTVVTKHINNIFKENELDKNSVCANFAHTAWTVKATMSFFIYRR